MEINDMMIAAIMNNQLLMLALLGKIFQINGYSPIRYRNGNQK